MSRQTSGAAPQGVGRGAGRPHPIIFKKRKKRRWREKKKEKENRPKRRDKGHEGRRKSYYVHFKGVLINRQAQNSYLLTPPSRHSGAREGTGSGTIAPYGIRKGKKKEKERGRGEKGT